MGLTVFDENNGSKIPKLGTFFPFRDGISICSGRLLIKHEILTTVTMFIQNFEIEFVRFVTMDKKKSDRGPEAPKRAMGAGSVVPDRDLQVKLRRK